MEVCLIDYLARLSHTYSLTTNRWYKGEESMKNLRIVVLSGFVAMAGILSPSISYAVPLDMSTLADSGTINGALFTRDNQLGQGTGNFQSFLRVQANGTEKGYNTDGALEFDSKPGQFTRSVKISDIPLVNINGTDYREFLLDAGEPGGNNNSLVIDVLDLYLLNAPNITGYPLNFPVLDRKYSFIGDNNFDSILLDNIIGNGMSDMFAYIPDINFSGTNNEYLYLYTEMSSTGGTFEEWGHREGGSSNVVPEPASMILFGSGMVGAFIRRRKKA